MKVKVDYEGQMRFSSGEGVSRVVMDAKEAVGGRGEAASPKHLVLQGLAGCTGLDVASMLGRQKIPFEDLSIEAEAEQNSAHPVVFKQITVTFHIKANPEHRPKIERAIELSETRFCGVSAMLGKTAEIETVLDLEPLS